MGLTFVHSHHQQEYIFSGAKHRVGLRGAEGFEEHGKGGACPGTWGPETVMGLGLPGVPPSASRLKRGRETGVGERPVGSP